jgi:hypothetical protein
VWTKDDAEARVRAKLAAADVRIGEGEKEKQAEAPGKRTPRGFQNLAYALFK